MALVCQQCGKTIRVNSKWAIKLWETPSGAVYVCSQKCLDEFN